MTTPDAPRTAVVPTPVATASPFVIDVPTLSRGTADRSEDLREPERLLEQWSRARVLTLDGGGSVQVEPSTTRLHTIDALKVAEAPPPGAVLLGEVDGVDHWAMRGHVADGAGLRELGALLSDTEAGLLTTATALLTWHDAAGFCPRCGLPSVPSPAGWSRMCPRHHEDFPRTDPAVIVLVHDGVDSMVLARQPIWPIGRMSVLAGFVEAGESLEHTVAREVLEEVGVRVTDVSYLSSQPWPFPRSLMVGFAARAEPGAPLLPRAGEIEEAHWFDRAAVRRMIAAEAATKGGGDRWLAPRPDNAAPPEGSAFEVILPGPVSIARRMIEGWVASG
jgi:NAD+ diphosphatase